MPPEPLEPRRALVLDDSPLVLALVRAALERRGFAVDTALTLDQLETARALRAPHIIILDIQMPEAFGDDVAVTLRGAYGVAVPILLMSTIAPAELALRAAGAGVEWISKRDGVEALVTAVERLVSSSSSHSHTRPGESL